MTPRDAVTKEQGQGDLPRVYVVLAIHDRAHGHFKDCDGEAFA